MRTRRPRFAATLAAALLLQPFTALAADNTAPHADWTRVLSLRPGTTVWVTADAARQHNTATLLQADGGSLALLELDRAGLSKADAERIRRMAKDRPDAFRHGVRGAWTDGPITVDGSQVRYGKGQTLHVADIVTSIDRQDVQRVDALVPGSLKKPVLIGGAILGVLGMIGMGSLCGADGGGGCAGWVLAAGAVDGLMGAGIGALIGLGTRGMVVRTIYEPSTADRPTSAR